MQATYAAQFQYHSLKTSILWCSASFIVQLSHPYMTTGKTIVLTRQTFVGKVMSLLFNMLSRLVINFLPRSKCLLISWLQSPSAVILQPQKIKSATVSYDLNQIPYDSTVEVTNRFNILDLIDRMPDELWTEVCNIVQEAVIKTIPKKKKCKKVKWLSDEALQIVEKRKEVKGKGKRKDIPI